VTTTLGSKPLATLRAEAGSSNQSRLVEEYLPLVKHVLGRLALALPTTLDREDLLSSGVFGLMRAAATFEPQRGVAFKTFAFTAIRGAILDELRRHDPIPRTRRERLRQIATAEHTLHHELGRPPRPEELAIALGVDAAQLDEDLLALQTSRVLSLQDSDEGEPALLAVTCPAPTAGPQAVAIDAEEKEHLADCIAKLPDAERRVVVLYYHEQLLLKDIGGVLGVSEGRVSQILTRALTRLRALMRDRDAEVRP
jgi:RNA polymerase sigma factor for flagellar operon FliA